MPSRADPRKIQRIQPVIPADLYRQLRVAAAEEGISLSELVCEACRHWLIVSGHAPDE